MADGIEMDEVVVGVGPTTIGPQSSSGGQGDASLGGRRLPGIAACGVMSTVLFSSFVVK